MSCGLNRNPFWRVQKFASITSMMVHYSLFWWDQTHFRVIGSEILNAPLTNHPKSCLLNWTWHPRDVLYTINVSKLIAFPTQIKNIQQKRLEPNDPCGWRFTTLPKKHHFKAEPLGVYSATDQKRGWKVGGLRWGSLLVRVKPGPRGIEL